MKLQAFREIHCAIFFDGVCLDLCAKVCGFYEIEFLIQDE